MNIKLADLLKLCDGEADASEIIFSANAHMLLQIDLAQELNRPPVPERKPWLFLNRDFPSFYVGMLERLMYPDGHVACFVADPSNPSMWGAHGVSHKWACLKFRAGTGHPTLDLFRQNGWGGSKNNVVANYSYAPHRFERIAYTAAFPEVDFFESLRALPRFKLDFWFGGANGERSTTALRMFKEDEEWRRDYWDKFSIGFRTKSPEWKHEDEHRLILHSLVQRFDDVESRKIKYRFSDLQGIIFGIKIKMEDKLEIIQTIKIKCAAENRQDFQFLQAYYSTPTKKIELAPLTLI